MPKKLNHSPQFFPPDYYGSAPWQQLTENDWLMIPDDDLMNNSTTVHIAGESEEQIMNDKEIRVKVEQFKLIPEPIKGRLSTENMTFHFSDARS